MQALTIITSFREYLDYIEQHIKNIVRAHNYLVSKCSDMKFVKDQSLLKKLEDAVLKHDVSKLSPHEFVQYQRAFHPSQWDNQNLDLREVKDGYSRAWQHHKENNDHHWENWTTTPLAIPEEDIRCVHMVIDWLAMSYEFGDNPLEYWEENKDLMKIPDEYLPFLINLLGRIS